MRLSIIAGLVAGLVLSTLAVAAPLPDPTGPVILVVSGAIGNTNGDGVARYDLKMLEALQARDTRTHSPWYDGAMTFSGPLGRALLADVQATGTMLRVTALNEYVTEIPTSDFLDYPVILATTLNGKLMSVRDKGPLFIIYPFDEMPALNNEVYYGRSAWQVKSIEVY